ncbi:transposase [Roseimarinus sediminis]|uniref:transposase n=1 Tax=Roseimarinus sediminis TaxID=1610899 RepID=UPI003D2530B1
MPHIIGENRNQFFMLSLNEVVPQNSFVRAIDAFVDAIDMESFGFTHIKCNDEGRPAYHPSVLMKLYLYAYRYGIRTSRKLEREAALNMEAIPENRDKLWLTSCQSHKYKTIADFRKNNAKAFRQVFRAFVKLLRDMELVDGQTIAIDSFKIRAQNSLKNNLNQAKIDRHITYIDNKVNEYQLQLDQCNLEDEQQELKAKIATQNQRKEEYLDIQQQLEESGNEQISLTDPDARSVVLHRNIINVGYNVQAASDSKHKLLVEYDTGDVNSLSRKAGILMPWHRLPSPPRNCSVLKGWMFWPTKATTPVKN